MADIAGVFGGERAKTFLGLPPGHLSSPQPGIAVLGVPLATPYPSTGTYGAAAPQAIRGAIAHYAAARDHHDFDFGGPILARSSHPADTVPAFDYGDLGLDENDASASRAAISQAISTLQSTGAIPVVIGGDDSIPIPILEGLGAVPNLFILQIDAHIDWRDEVGGERLGLSSNMRRASEMAHVSGITQIGARGIGSARPGDARDAVDWGAHLFPMPRLASGGIAAAIDTLPKGANLYINLDVDALDPSEMPAVIGPAPGGLTFRETTEIIARASERCKIAGFALAEFYPDRDHNGLAALTAARLICHALGRIARQG